MRLMCAGAVAVLVLVGMPGAAAAQSKAEQELIQIEKDWCTSSLNRDAAILTRILAHDYLGVTSAGTTETKSAALASLKDTSDTLDVCVDSDFKVRIYNESALVTALANRSGTEKGVAYKDRKSLYTDTFIRKDGRWQCVGSQSTRVGNAR
jgi:ketosteroid isomerase-like protein